MRIHALRWAAAIAAGCGLTSAVAQAAGGPPPPTAVGGQTVTQVAAGLNTPTSFAFGDGAVFEGDGGSNQKGVPVGGVFLLRGGAGVRLAPAPQFVAGLAWHDGALYLSGGTITGPGSATWTVQRWSGFNGTRFAHKTVLYTAPKGFQGFNGIAFGPNGRLYVGADVGLLNHNDHGPARTPFVYDILSMKATGRDVSVFASGIRQPWQMAFAPGSRDPLVSDLGQDSGARNPPDFILRVHPGDDFGFPKCNGTMGSACRGFATPFRRFAPHTDVMGMAIIGRTLYVTSFKGPGARSNGGEVLSMPLSGGPLTPVLTGFVAPTVGLGAHGQTLYVGELTGQVFSVTP